MKWNHNKDQLKVYMIAIILSFTLVSTPFISTAAVSINQSPEAPTDPYPVDGADNVSLNPELSVNISMEQGQTLNLTFCNATDPDDVKVIGYVNITDEHPWTRVSISPWSNLDYSTTYSWYVEVSDGDQTVKSETWSFTTLQDIPPWITDETGSNPKTGDPFLFRSEVTDNDQVEKVKVNYTTDVWDYHKNVSMENIDVNDFQKEIDVPLESSLLNYSILASDINDNWNSTGIKSLTVTDNKKPKIEIDPSVPDSQLLYNYVNITANITDNRGVSTVLIKLIDPEGSSLEKEMGNIGTDWYYNQSYDDIGEYEYRITAEDVNGNIKKTELKSLQIKDKTKPEIEDWSKPKAFTGDTYVFKSIVTDDNEVSDVYVEYWYENERYDSVNLTLVNLERTTWLKSINIPDDNVDPLYYKLSAVDISGNWNSSRPVKVDIIDDIPPVPVVGGDKTVNVTDIVTFNASSSYDNIGIVKYEWKIGDLTINGRIINYVFKDVRDYEVRLVVWDECGNKGEKAFITTVVDNKKPTADAGTNLIIDEGTEVVLDGSGSSDQVGIINYTWTIDKDTELYGMTPNYTFTNPGTYFVELNVTDEAGNYDKDTVEVWVKDVTDPVADAGKDRTALTNQKVTFNGNHSHDNGEIDSYEWHIKDQVYYGEKIQREFTKVGEYEVTLKVIDKAGNYGTDKIYVTVGDGTKPLADAGEDSTAIVGEEITFDGKDSSDNVGIVNYTWTILETNQVLYGEKPTYEFEENGTYNVVLTVRDGNYNMDQDMIKVEVEKKEKQVSFLSLFLPFAVLSLSITGLFVFFMVDRPDEETDEEEEKEESEEKEETEDTTLEMTKEEIVSKLESGDLTAKQLEKMMAETQKSMRKDVAETYQYLEVLMSKAQQYRSSRSDQADKQVSEEEKEIDEDSEDKEPSQLQDSQKQPSQPPQSTKQGQQQPSQQPSQQQPSQQQPPQPKETPPDMNQAPPGADDDMEDMMNQLEDMDDSEMPEGFPSPDESEEPPSLDDATETGDISQDDIDDLFH